VSFGQDASKHSKRVFEKHKQVSNEMIAHFVEKYDLESWNLQLEKDEDAYQKIYTECKEGLCSEVVIYFEQNFGTQIEVTDFVDYKNKKVKLSRYYNLFVEGAFKSNELSISYKATKNGKEIDSPMQIETIDDLGRMNYNNQKLNISKQKLYEKAILEIEELCNNQIIKKQLI
jgi:CHAT domain-containing protein